MVYLIVLIWNGAKYLPKLFKSLENLNYPKEKIKIIAIDSNSQDSSIEFLDNLEWPNLEIVKLPENPGFAKGNNLGIKEALDKSANYVVLLNQDTYVEPNFLKELITAAKQDEKIGIVQPLILYYNNPGEIASTGNQLHYLGYGWCKDNHKILTDYKLPITDNKIIYASGAAVLYKTEMLKKIGIFDENYFSYLEDADICLRAKLAGYETILAPKAVCYHDVKNPVSKNKVRYFWLEKNRLYLVLKFYSLKTLILILPAIFFMDTTRLILSFKKRYFWQWLKAHFWFIFNFKKWQTARREIQQNKKMGNKEFLQNLSGEIIYQETNNFLLNKTGNPIMKSYWQIIKKII